ncbi:MAG TPA: hypothetical protein VIL37_06080 [Natronosporangium sp.]
MSKSPYDVVLHAARDLPRVDTALSAEMLGAALLGSVYAVADGMRAETVRAFVGRFLAHTARRRTDAARAIRSVFATLVPDADGAERVKPGPNPPAWHDQLGRVRLVGSWAYGDVYGDQTSYLATFEYEQPELGGEPHAVVALVDHNIGIVKDLFVGYPADRIVGEVREAVANDPLVWLTEVDPGTLRSQVGFYLNVTDEISSLPEDGALATDRLLVGARLATLPLGEPPAPPVGVPDPAALAQSFLDSPAGRRLDRSTPEAEAAVQYAVRLILDFAQDAPDADPLRWSPAVAGLFLLDWVHRRAVLDEDDVATLPTVTRAWAAWAGEQRGLPADAAAATDEVIETMTPEFARLQGSGERRGPAVTAMAQLLADGVDPSDEAALTAWLNQYPDHHNGTGTGNGNGQVPRPR